MFTFVQVLAALSMDPTKKFKSATVLDGSDFITMTDGVVSISSEEDEGYNDALELDAAALGATDYVEFVPVIIPDVPQLYAYFSDEDNRWKSTSNPEKLRARGVNVKLFVATDEV